MVESVTHVSSARMISTPSLCTGDTQLSIGIGEICCIPLLIIGSILFGFAQYSWDVWVPILTHLVLGVLVVIAIFPKLHSEFRFFLIMYSVCIFWGGASQVYALFQDGDPTGITDAVTYFGRILDSPPHYTWNQVMTLPHPDGTRLGTNAPLAVWIWQRVYNFHLALGCTFGSHIGVTFNAMIVGLSAAVTVATARVLFCGDLRRIIRVGRIFSVMGLFWLFGSLHLRDCFALLLNSIVLYSLILALVRRNTLTTIITTILVIFASITMYYIRDKAAVLFGIFALLAGLCWYWCERMTPAKTLVTFLVPLLLLVGSVHLLDYLSTAKIYADEKRARWVELSEAQFDDSSLGMALVVNQPLPIRCILGLGFLLVNPIPVWGFLKPGVSPYHLFLTWNGLCVIFLTPLVLNGIWFIFHSQTYKKIQSIQESHVAYLCESTMWSAELFLLGFVMISTLAFTATTLLIRHYGQFLPGILLLAALPGRNYPEIKRISRITNATWFIIVIVVHMAWFVMKYL